MKSLFFAFTMFFSFSTFAYSGVAVLAAAFETLAASGSQKYQLEGETTQELVESYQAQADGDNEIVLDAKEVENSDEIIWGTTDAQTFSSLVFAAVHFMDDDAYENEVIYTEDKIDFINKVLLGYERLDVIYSWNPKGDSVCGQTLTTPVIIDPQTKTAYEFNFYKIEGC